MAVREPEKFADTAVGRKTDRQDRQIIEVLSSEYSGVYLIDLKTGLAVPYSMVDSVADEIGGVFKGECRYIDAFRISVERLAHPEDRERMREAGTVGNIMKELRHKKTFCTVFRNVDNKYCEMKFIKVGSAQGAPESVVLCFSEKDEELRAETEAAERLRRNMDIISLFSSDYFLVSHIDLDTGEYDSYSFSGKDKNGSGSMISSGKSYSAAYRNFVSTQVCPEDRERMAVAGSVFTILEELRKSNTYVVRYRNVQGRYNEMKYVKVGDEEYPKRVAVGFADRDAEIREDILREKRRRVYHDLTADCLCIIYIDIHADPANNVTTYRSSALLQRLIPDAAQEPCFEKGLIRIRDHFVAPEDKERFLEMTATEKIARTLEKQPACYVRFNALIEGKRVPYEFKFTGDRDGEGALLGLVAGLHKVWSFM